MANWGCAGSSPARGTAGRKGFAPMSKSFFLYLTFFYIRLRQHVKISCIFICRRSESCACTLFLFVAIRSIRHSESNSRYSESNSRYSESIYQYSESNFQYSKSICRYSESIRDTGATKVAPVFVLLL